MYINYFLAWSFYLQVQVRSTIIQQLKDLKVLEETAILTAEQFKETKGKSFKRNVKSLNLPYKKHHILSFL